MSTLGTPLARSLTEAERAISSWLAGSLNRPQEAWDQWANGPIALLALGRRFSAVRLADELVYAVAVGQGATAVLRACLRGPVIHDPRGRRFYALVPPSPSPRSLGPYATHLGLGHYLGVPRIGDNEPDAAHASYWAVPMSAPGALCDPIRLDQVIEAGTTALDSQAES
ncbi:hypothetical protein [Streptomyces sp. WM6378]|uniref:hypothetical protein n=1 Tax=Streptomyces sp. WM6378 TaxID=1415557 RepID=UPI0006ADD081|nr:hypothetical protein [Streptomyces sp. WM6378]KOU46046.1 hypothetical protein ADK54_14440 [Streptomyces sp. WM6378]